MTLTVRALLGACAVSALAAAASAQTTITVATVNNGDMIRMQGLTDDFTSKNPDIALGLARGTWVGKRRDGTPYGEHDDGDIGITLAETRERFQTQRIRQGKI